ncbi:MAG: divalent metal cation transporter [Chthoniobacterales bacterium]
MTDLESSGAGLQWGKGFTVRISILARLSPPIALLTLIMANIGTTITPWQIFFHQSAVVDKGMDVADITAGKIDTFVGSLMTCVVAVFIIIATAGVFHFNLDQDPKWRFEEFKEGSQELESRS